jgi:hypothetical protein
VAAAGVTFLRDGQKVKLLEQRAQTNSAPAASGR